MVSQVLKRDGRTVEFNNRKIIDAILKAMEADGGSGDIVLAAEIADKISESYK